MIAPPPGKPSPHDSVETAAPGRAATLLHSFRYGFAGIRYLLWTQRNAKIHSAIALVAVTLGFVLRIARDEWLALLLMIILVLAAEGFNTAIEAVVDLASPEYHPLAKIAKDVAAGTVLLVAIGAVIFGIILFLPYVLALLREVV